MKRVLVFTMLLVGFAWSSASAQTTDAGYADALTPSLASVARTMHVTMRRNIVEAAEAAPASEYSFRPTPDLHNAMSYCDVAYKATTDANFNQP
jgi:hypothetical protein